MIPLLLYAVIGFFCFLAVLVRQIQRSGPLDVVDALVALCFYFILWPLVFIIQIYGWLQKK